MLTHKELKARALERADVKAEYDGSVAGVRHANMQK